MVRRDYQVVPKCRSQIICFFVRIAAIKVRSSFANRRSDEPEPDSDPVTDAAACRPGARTVSAY
jgi:hypothetical protein